ncbi:N-acetylmuramoyl-L-alanine amidase [Anianabacter salinae]|uniref:N-acetylmuramoyl-L-alanine amidase n=1 Tax=Anianabacter salinae TaxID=2851023 RepID=UPI00225E5066|nr:N-acetylmuramoyl-L-alanine amidase [Anianabacter salinae]MBV0911678.1 N-acetylmuramoyl-L-alanine amidase [Anianabacter salinae]
MSRILTILAALMLSLMPALAAAQGLTGLARVDPSRSGAEAVADGLGIDLALSQPVPWRVFTLDAPFRAVVDFSEVAWDGVAPEAFRVPGVRDVVLGRFRPGWSRMVLTLDGPMIVDTAEMRTGPGGADLRLRLTAATPEAFAARSGVPDSAVFDLPEPVAGLPPAKQRQTGDRPLVIALDPGHGGIDPGAEVDGVTEAVLMLQFARELEEILVRAGMEVVLTRSDDSFVPLEARQSLARAAGADVFLSLHADALAEGRASGATVYTLSDTASDAASEILAERHDRADLLAGIDLTDQDDVIAGVLMDLARTETHPRSERLAEALVAGLRQSVGRLHKRPHLEASFSVLKAPDLPAALIELGFMSNPRDLENLLTPQWRRLAAEGIRNALRAWAAADAAEAALLRQ